MSMPDKEKLFKELEEQGVQKVQEKLAMECYGKNKVKLVKLWLDRQQEQTKSTKGDGKMAKISATEIQKQAWKDIENEFGYSKRAFGKKFNFVKNDEKRKIIFRDIGQAYFMASNGMYKPAAILAGGVIEELLRIFLKSEGVGVSSKTLSELIKACNEKGLLIKGHFNLAESIREFRNLVHLKNEKSKKEAISSSIAKGAVSSIFTIVDALG